MQDEAGHALRVANGIIDCDGASRPQAQQGESVAFGRFDNGLQILNLPFQGKIQWVPIRQASAAGIVTNESMSSRQHRQPRATDGIVPIEPQMTDPMRRRDHCWSGAARRKAKTDAVAARAEADFLAAVKGHGHLVYVPAGYPAMFDFPHRVKPSRSRFGRFAVE